MMTTHGPPSFREIEHEGWDRLAENYDRFTGSFTPQALPFLLDAVRVRPGTRLLDVACGPGYGVSAARARGAVATGLDFAAGMVREARKYCPDDDIREGDAEALPFGAGMFDAAICAFGLLHMADPDRAIAEAHRVLRAGGRFAFTVWCPPDKTDFFGLVMEAVRAHGDINVPMPPAPPMFRFSDHDECRGALARTGFTAVSVVEIKLAWHPDSAQEVLDYNYKSSVRMPMLLNPQTDAAREAIHREILTNTSRFTKDGRLELAWPAVLASGQKRA